MKMVMIRESSFDGLRTASAGALWVPAELPIVFELERLLPRRTDLKGLLPSPKIRDAGSTTLARNQTTIYPLAATRYDLAGVRRSDRGRQRMR